MHARNNLTVPPICCPQCKGRGKVALPDQLRRTLAVIHQLGKPTVPEIARRLRETDLVATAINQRVRKLVRLRLVKKLHGVTPCRYEVPAA